MATSKSEISSLLKQYKIKVEDVNREVTDRHVEKISQSHCKKWKSLPAYLEMEGIVASDIDIEPIEEEEKRKNFFSKWKEEKGSKATYKVLIRALLEMKCKKDAESVCEMIAPSTSNGMHFTFPHALTPLLVLQVPQTEMEYHVPIWFVKTFNSSLVKRMDISRVPQMEMEYHVPSWILKFVKMFNSSLKKRRDILWNAMLVLCIIYVCQ